MPRKNNSGENNPAWKGGIVQLKSGYVIVHCPDHQNADGSGYVYQHRLVLEKKLGRFLKKDEIAHHLNHIKNDNRPENVELSNRSKHVSLHRTGVPRSEETKRKIGLKNKGNTVNIGRVCSAETRKRISEALKKGGKMQEVANRRWGKREAI